MEVSEFLSWEVLDTSGLASRSSTPKRPGSLALATLLPLKLEDSTKLVDTSSQVSTLEASEMDDPTLEEILASPPPWLKLQCPVGKPLPWMWPNSKRRPTRPGCLLMTRSSLNAWQRKQVSDFGMALHQNEVGDHWGHQGSKDPLCLHHLWHGGPLDSANKSGMLPASRRLSTTALIP